MHDRKVVGVRFEKRLVGSCGPRDRFVSRGRVGIKTNVFDPSGGNRLLSDRAAAGDVRPPGRCF